MRSTWCESGPGQYCEPQSSSNERAVLWRGNKVLDLNDAIPSHLRVTLASASSINRRGQILAIGYNDDDPQPICPLQRFDPQTGERSLDFSQRCRNQRLYVLTPQ